MLGEAILSEAFKLALGELFSSLKSTPIKFKCLDGKSLDKAYLKASSIENVKTIWQVDKSVNLNEFYYPSNIMVDGSLICVSSLSAFPCNSKVVIQGTAGQGKSILLRYLAGHELKFGKTIPLFIELRKVTDKVSLPRLICQSLSEMEIECSENDLDYIFSSGKFTLLLDAFDEIPEANIVDCLSYIESLSSKHYDQQILITSRPGAEIQKIAAFRVYNLQEISQSDFKPMLMKFFYDDEETVDQIVNGLSTNKSQVASLVTTPLLLTLLAITYKTFHKIPEQLHHFYEDIFHVLVNRHDSTKPGFRREYKSMLNEKSLEELFCVFCFQCMVGDKTSLTRHEAVQAIKRAIEYSNIKPVSELTFLSDCIKNTCLLLEEGFNYHFIHKSIREYHAAKFISSSQDKLKEKFYKKAKESFNKYRVEMDFLSVIDVPCFNKYYLHPMLEEIFSELEGVIDFSNGFNNIDLKLFFGSSYIYSSDDKKSFNSFDFRDSPIFRWCYKNEIHNLSCSLVSRFFSLGARPVCNEVKVSIYDALKRANLLEVANDEIGNTLTLMYSNYKDIKSEIYKNDRLIDELMF